MGMTSSVAVADTLAMWVGMGVSSVAMVLAAIFAGRSHRMWQAFSLLLLEFLLNGSAIVFWMFLVWFTAKVVTSTGVAAPIALLLALAIGIAIAVLTVVRSLRLVQAGYTIFGRRDRFDVDFGNSVWVGRWSAWRPNELRQS